MILFIGVSLLHGLPCLRCRFNSLIKLLNLFLYATTVKRVKNRNQVILISPSPLTILLLARVYTVQPRTFLSFSIGFSCIVLTHKRFQHFFFKEMAISALSASQVTLQTILAQSTAYNKTRTGENVTEKREFVFETLN